MSALIQMYRLLLLDIVVPVLLGLASFMDVKSREIDVYVFVAGIVASIPSTILSLKLLTSSPLGIVYLVQDILVVGVVAGFTLLGLKGAADLLAFLVIALAAPTPLKAGGIFTPVFTCFFYYVIISIVPVVALLVYNMARNRREIAQLPMPYKIIYPLIGVPKKARRLLEDPGWWYPLNLCGYSVLFDINMDPEDIRKAVREAVEKGCVSPEDKVWCSYGVPALPLILASYILYLLLGSTPLLYFVKTLAGV